jgi:hypothetical protein
MSQYIQMQFISLIPALTIVKKVIGGKQAGITASTCQVGPTA